MVQFGQQKQLINAKIVLHHKVTKLLVKKIKRNGNNNHINNGNCTPTNNPTTANNQTSNNNIMAWRFRKLFGFGKIRTTISKNGIGNSIGFLGFRFGKSPEGRKYWSFGIPNTSIYYIKYY